MGVQHSSHSELEYAILKTAKPRPPKKKAELREGAEATHRFEETMTALFQVPKAQVVRNALWPLYAFAWACIQAANLITRRT